MDTRRGEDRTGWAGTYMYVHTYIQHVQSYLPGECSCDFGSSGCPCGSHMAGGRYEAGLSMGDRQREQRTGPGYVADQGQVFYQMRARHIKVKSKRAWMCSGMWNRVEMACEGAALHRRSCSGGAGASHTWRRGFLEGCKPQWAQPVARLVFWVGTGTENQGSRQ